MAMQEVPTTTIEAVECVQCHTLHKKAGFGYLKLSGQLVRRSERYYASLASENVKQLGSEVNPTVLCNNHRCLQEFLDPDHAEVL